MISSPRLCGELDFILLVDSEPPDQVISAAPQSRIDSTETEQSNRDYQILAVIGPNTSEEQKLDLILNFTKFRPYKFPTKLEYDKAVLFNTTTWNSTY